MNDLYHGDEPEIEFANQQWQEEQWDEDADDYTWDEIEEGD